MPTIRIVADAKSYIYIDGIKVGVLETNRIFTYDICTGEHFINIIHFHYNSLKFQRVISILHDQVVVFNFNNLIRDKLDVIYNLELFRYKSNGKYGFFEPTTRTIIIEPKYDTCSHFSKEGFAIVQNNNLKGIINKKGSTIIPIQYDEIVNYEYYYKVTNGTHSGYLDLNGNWLIKPQTNNINFIYKSFNNIIGYYYINNNYCYVYDLQGKNILTGDYNRIRYDSGFFIATRNDTKRQCVFNTEGLLLFEKITNDITVEKDLFIIKTYQEGHTKYGLIDITGKTIVEPIYNYICCFENGYIELSYNNTYQISCYKDNKLTVLSDKYKYISRLSSNFLLFQKYQNILIIDIERDNTYEVECEDVSFCDNNYGGTDYLKIKKNGKFGLIGLNPILSYITDCEYDEITNFHNGYACVKKLGLYGAIDKTGNLVVKCNYANTFWFNEEGYAKVYKIGRSWLGDPYPIGYGIIDSAGNEIIGFNYYKELHWEQYSSNHKEDYPLVSAIKNDIIYLIDYSNNIVATYDKHQYFLYKSCNGIIRRNSSTEYKYLYGFINKKGELVIPCIYEDIKLLDTQLISCKLNGLYAIFNKEGYKITDFIFEEIEEFHNEYTIAKKESGYGIIDRKGYEITEFHYLYIDEFYRTLPFDAELNMIYSYDDYDEDGNAICHKIAEEEGPFRFGIACVRTHYTNSHEFINEQGNTIYLRKLGDTYVDITFDLPSNTSNIHEELNKSSNPINFTNSNKEYHFEIYTRIAGVTFENRQMHISKLHIYDKLLLKREKNNIYDNNAVAVYDTSGHHIGYIPKEISHKIANKLDNGELLNVTIVSISGSSNTNLGVNISITN